MTFRPRPGPCVLTACAILALAAASARAAPAAQGDRILNVVSVQSTELPDTLTSAPATVTIRIATTATIELLRLTPPSAAAVSLPVEPELYRTGAAAGAPWAPLAAPRPTAAAPLALPATVPLRPASALHQGDPIFVRVADLDQNLDRGVRETLFVTLTDDLTGDTEVVRLTETGPDTGVFAGYVPTAAAGAATAYDGALRVADASTVTARHVDVADATDVASAAAVVDPTSRVFDSRTGISVNGAAITLVDAATGLPASVRSDDGISSFPTTVVSGATVTDGAGRTFAFGPGEFRFPFVPPGTYRYDVTPPAGFAAPSRATDADLAGLPGGPFAIGAGSRGEPFAIDAAPGARVDVPVDSAAVSLWVRKTAGATRVGVGDFLAYEIAATNLDTAVAAPAVTVRDALPAGFRYQRGSARRDGAPAADPAQTDDGRTLTFAVGDLAPGATATLRLVVQVGARAQVGVDAVNVASAASAGGGASNLAEARVRVADDLLSTRSFLMGRVTTGACPAPGAEAADGLAGARVFLEDGTFSVSDRDGLFHFEGVRPGVHVVQLDLASLPAGLEAVACAQDDRRAGRAYSQLFDLQGGTLWRVDFHVRPRAAAPEAASGGSPAGAPGPAASPATAVAPAPPPPAVALSLAHRVIDRDAAEVRAQVRGGEAPVADARLVVTLPEGLEYEPGSSVLDGAPGSDPSVDGRTLTYPVGAIAPRAERTVALRARVRAGAAPGERMVSAVVSGAGLAGTQVETSASPEVVRVHNERVRGPLRFVMRPHFPTFGAALSAGDRAELASLARRLAALRPEHLVVVGHTDDLPIAPRSRSTFADNAALSLARAGAVRAFLLPALRMTEEQIEIAGKGEAEPLADNRTASGRALNRRVEVLIHDPQTVDRTVLVAASPAEASVAPAAVPAAPAAVAAPVPAVATAPAAPAVPAPAAAAPAAKPAKERDGFVSPLDGELVPDRIGAVQVRLASYLTAALAVEGQPVDPSRIGYRSVDPRTGKTTYTYVGVDLGEQGTRTLTLTGTDPFGNVRVREQIAVTRTGEIAAMRLVSAEGNVADGRTPVRVRVALLDGAGDTVRGATRLALRGGTLRPWRAPDAPATLEDASSVGVDKDGWVIFDPVAETGSHRAVLTFGRATLEVEAWVRPELRDWILVGLAEGTVGYGTAVKHLEALPPGDAAEELQADGRVAFYAKGRVRGDWLLTVAYDSRRGAADRDPLFQIVDPNTYFTLYGDVTAERHDAPSTRKIYVKIEREQLYALFGDHETGLTVTELSRYSRRLNGVKAGLRTRHAEVTAFAAPTDAAHVRDELPGDGTSGLYRLSRRLVTVGSETVTVVTRDRFRSEVVRETRALTRFLDYAIDYDDGTILFREPIPSRSADLDPITVVVEYEAGSAGEDWTAGGRAGVRAAEDRVRAGVTAIHQGEGDRSRNLYGADLALDVGTHTRVRAEAAVTEAAAAGASDVATAWLAEATHASHALEARVYAREQERGFGLGQQALSEAGTRKIGLEAAKHFGDALTVTGQAYRQDTFATGVERLFGEARLRLGTLAGDHAYVGVLEASDRLADGDRRESGQLTAGAKWVGARDRLTLAADWAQSLWGDANADFPTRLIFRGEWKLRPDVALTGTEELTWGAAGTTQTTRLGLRTTPWKGGALTTSVGSLLDENASRVVGTIGLRQTLDLTDAWKLDLAGERSETVLEDGAYRANPNVPPASGSVTGEDFTALSAGASWRIPHLVWDSRAELRVSESDRRWTVLSGAVLERGASWGFSGRAQFLGSRADGGDVATRASVRFGVVYRPPATRWILLNRLDATVEDGQLRTAGSAATSGLAVDGSLRLVDNMLANFRPNPRLQVSLGYGAKWVRERFDGAVHAGYTDQASLELRRDLSPRWDVGLRASVLHVWTAQQVAFSAGPSLGWSPAPNVWLSVGLNATGYDDRDFASASHAAVGPYIRMRVKLDQDSVKDAARWLNLQ